jgi:hypothetical protein
MHLTIRVNVRYKPRLAYGTLTYIFLLVPSASWRTTQVKKQSSLTFVQTIVYGSSTLARMLGLYIVLVYRENLKRKLSYTYTFIYKHFKFVF